MACAGCGRRTGARSIDLERDGRAGDVQQLHTVLCDECIRANTTIQGQYRRPPATPNQNADGIQIVSRQVGERPTDRRDVYYRNGKEIPAPVAVRPVHREPAPIGKIQHPYIVKLKDVKAVGA